MTDAQIRLRARCRGSGRARAKRATLVMGLLSGLFLVNSTQAEAPPTEEQPASARGAGGQTTVYRFDTNAFSLPAANLTLRRRTRFFAGNAFFTQAWVPGPASTTARDGLGPLFNTNTCQSCHLKDGRGRPPAPGEAPVSILVRLSLREGGAATASPSARVGVVPHPRYGDQIQTRAIPGVAPEGVVALRWRERTGEFADGRAYLLVEPVLEIREPAYGELGDATLFSLRVAPALVGMGLLEAIPEDLLLRHADPEDADCDGISGRANRVWDVERGMYSLGRFGWKAGQPSVRQQVAAAFAGDLGISSGLYPDGSCAPEQQGCRASERRMPPELPDEILDLVTFYVSVLGVPARRESAAVAEAQGLELFREIGCTRCHVESFTTAPRAHLPELRGQRIEPYTDLLLHDMGAGLADGRSEFEASGREWRTPPLWGIGLVEIVSRHTRFLHDGRARNLEEAILWHGGEAQRAADRYRALSVNERAQLSFFLRSL